MANPTNYEKVPDLEKHIKLVLYLFTLVLGVSGNTLVLVILARKIRRVSNDLFIINLAVADLTLLVFSVPVMVLYYGGFMSPGFVCKVVWPMMTVSNTVSIFTLTLMAICRCHVILHSFRPDIRQRNIYRAIALTWISALILLLPLMIVATSNPVGGCKEEWLTKMDGKIYTIVLVILQYVLPLTLIAIAYVWIAVDLWKPRNMNSSWAATDRKGREKRRKENVQIVKTLATIVVLFAICMLPGHIAWLLGDFGDEEEQKVAVVIIRFFDILVYIHSCLNPIVYGTLTKYFRREYSRYIAYVFCCRKHLHSTNSRPSHNPTHENILPRTGASL